MYQLDESSCLKSRHQPDVKVLPSVVCSMKQFAISPVWQQLHWTLSNRNWKHILGGTDKTPSDATVELT